MTILKKGILKFQILNILKYLAKNITVTQESLNHLKILYTKKLLKTNININDDIYFSELRHYKCLENISIKLELALNNFEEIEIASNFIDEALYELDDIFGRHDKEEELDIIFRKFCIGK